VIAEPGARRYAEAAYLIAREDGTVEAWLEGLQAMAAAYGDPQAQRFFTNMRVPLEAKQQAVEEALKTIEPKARNLALLLLRRGRTGLAPQIAQAYQEMVDAEKGISHALVTSAVPLNDAELEAVRSKLTELTGGEVQLRTEVDERIIGGLVVRIGDRLIDGSTRSRLSALKQRLAGVRA
jgi:F-type H+-transporting ATPase subunit delta